uniref:Uncharacterized protein n=1 Tax=Trichobilharzia regenti TaxID=157069 RepID=A0AA85IZL7_TRIRE|nr:unnamed protein product [Trichobilharzia regenti]
MVSRIVLVIIASVFIVCEFVHGGNSGGVADGKSPLLVYIRICICKVMYIRVEPDKI